MCFVLCSLPSEKWTRRLSSALRVEGRSSKYKVQRTVFPEMKRCPTCNQTFDEGWLSFCTNDGTTLVEDSPSPPDLMKTIMAPPPPPVSRPNEQANWSSPSGGIGAGQFPAPRPTQPMWQPPPPPSYAAGPQQSLAVASLVCGIFTITIGWCCYLGVITGPVAIEIGRAHV